MWCFLLLTLFVTVQGRAVNISNTWVLPEEGFPVFYRYFRDRISWYEADAVCQFHHANLVTVDTTAQYDAVRAYLKELDISSAVWVGLIRSNPDGDFTWTDYRGLSGDGYWSAAPDTRSAPLCAAADPAADYRWEARACGGPSVASFICELPVPQWALGNEGCMVRELPALTVLYLPESAAVQLTADCGLAGVKRVQCTGNVKREELLKELACTEEDQTSPTLNGTSPITSWQITTDSLFTNQDNSNNEASTEENVTTEHEDDINQSTSLKVISTSFSIIPDTSNKITLKPSVMDKTYKIPLQKNIDMVYSNDLKNNETPQIVHNDDLFTNEQHGKQDNDKILQRTKLHDELARLGNFDTIFSQPTDHFVPPLVMAKAKISEDMTALSIEEKLAQKVSERQLKQDIQQDFVVTANHLNKLYRTETINSTSTTALPLINLITSTKGSNNEQSVNKMSPKKYKNKYNDMKQKILKNSFPKSINSYEPVQTTPILTKLSEKNTNTTSTMKTITEQPYFDEYQTKSQSIGDTSLELTVIIKETIANQSTDGNIVPTHSPLLINISINKSNIKDDETGFTSTTSTVDPPSTFDLKKEDLIDVNIFNDENKHSDPISEIITSIPAFEGSLQSSEDNVTKDSTLKKSMTVLSLLKSINSTPNIVESTATTVNSRTDNISTNTAFQVNSNVFTNSTDEFSNDLYINDSVVNASKTDDISDNVVSSSNGAIKEGFDTIIDADFDLEKNITDSSSEIDDFQSPLLSGANDPLPKPNRSRRLQQQPRIKFNPFRILG